MFRVLYPPTYEPERLYVFDVLLRDFLGLAYVAQPEERSDVLICLDDDVEKQELHVAEGLFRTPPEQWLQKPSLPQQPLPHWDTGLSQREAGLPPLKLVEPLLPVIYGERLRGGDYVEAEDNVVRLGLDVFGSAFFMLTRYEEVVNDERDGHERYPAKASLAYQEGFLDRPIVNEYLEVLWAAIQRLWPATVRRERTFQMKLSHDVDWPLGVATRTVPQVFRMAAGDVVVRKNVTLAMRRMRSLMKVRQGNTDADICNTFDFIMSCSEEQGLVSSFYFISDHTAGALDGNYSIEHPWIRNLLRRIHERGHQIGLHPSYHTFRNEGQLQREFDRFLDVMEAEGIYQPVWGGRQHYLRWESPTTWQAYENAGLDYDSTLSHADHSGFRCGVCYEYAVFNLKTRQALRLRERPLVVMEGTLFAPQYMNLTHEASWQELRKLRNRCQLFQGDFILLWHNSELIQRHDVSLYRNLVVDSAAARTLYQ